MLYVQAYSVGHDQQPHKVMCIKLCTLSEKPMNALCALIVFATALAMQTQLLVIGLFGYISMKLAIFRVASCMIE